MLRATERLSVRRTLSCRGQRVGRARAHRCHEHEQGSQNFKNWPSAVFPPPPSADERGTERTPLFAVPRAVSPYSTDDKRALLAILVAAVKGSILPDTRRAQGRASISWPLFREHARLQQLRQHVGTEAADVRLQLAARRRVERLRVDERGDALDLRFRRLRVWGRVVVCLPARRPIWSSAA